MNDKIDKRTKQLTNIFGKIKFLDNGELSHLYESVRLHNDCLFIVAELTSEAYKIREHAYLERKHVYAETVKGASGTVAEKEAEAELAIHELRKEEADAGSLYDRYNRMFKALDHRLIDLRQNRNVLEKEMTYINDKQG